MKCRHKGARITGFAPQPTIIPSAYRDPRIHSWPRVECDICEVCGHWLSLGPANDEPPEVQVEIRAAEVSRMRITSAWLNGEITDGEREGWDKHLTADSPTSTTEDAGYLARQIATHEDKS